MMAAPSDFIVHLARRGESLVVGKDETILSALLRSGIAIAHGCTAGTCGICETAVVAGVPLHRDQIIDRTSPAAARSIMLCCSRSRSPELTLDL